jgi:protein-S-isoprenylcysteine O-methyltransferase Ste14
MSASCQQTGVIKPTAQNLEEHNLIELFGDDYRRYKERVSMLIPWRTAA